MTGWVDEDDEQVTSAVLVAGEEPVKAVKDSRPRLAKSGGNAHGTPAHSSLPFFPSVTL